MWNQLYDPLNSPVLSTLLAALPLVVLLGLLARHGMRAHYAALLGLATALGVAILAQRMPAGMAFRAAAFGAAYGFFPIGWIVLNVLFLHALASDRGLVDELRVGITRLTDDRRLQLLFVAFSFGAFFEGAAGFGTPVAVTGALLIALGFEPFEASVFSLIANTAPVAYGALGTPIIALQGVTGLDLNDLSAMVGRQLPLFSLIVPFWLIWAYAGFRGMKEVWPAVLVAGVSFAVPQFLVSNFHGPWLVDIVAAVVSMASLAALLRVWRPAQAWAGVPAGAPRVVADAVAPDQVPGGGPERLTPGRAGRALAYLPWIVLSVVVFLWGLPQVKAVLNGLSAPKLAIAGLDKAIFRVPPVVATAAPEAAVFNLNWLSATGTAILLAALITGIVIRARPADIMRTYGRTIVRAGPSLVTIAAMLALGYTARYSGQDAILGLAFAHTGVLYPFFGTLLGWLGVALTGSDTSSNVLFGSLQTITARKIGVSETLMAAANSSGGVMGKMIDAQSIVVASTATRWFGHEAKILRYVFRHSLALAALVGIWVMLQAYVWPISRLVVR
jgi:lactate permease